MRSTASTPLSREAQALSATAAPSTSTLPYVFLVTDGAQDNQYKDVPNGGWHGSNHATVLNDTTVTYKTICATLKSRGIIVSVLNIPYQTINPVNTSFAGNEDDLRQHQHPEHSSRRFRVARRRRMRGAATTTRRSHRRKSRLR